MVRGASGAGAWRRRCWRRCRPSRRSSSGRRSCRALAALGSDPQVQRALIAEAGRGLDFFRSAVIEALGEHRAAYAVDAIAAVAKLDGPLQDDAVLALGRIGDRARGRGAGVADAGAAGARRQRCTRRSACSARTVRRSIKALVDDGDGASARRRRSCARGDHRAWRDRRDAGAVRDRRARRRSRGRRRRRPRRGRASRCRRVAVRSPDAMLAWLDALDDDDARERDRAAAGRLRAPRRGLRRRAVLRRRARGVLERARGLAGAHAASRR